MFVDFLGFLGYNAGESLATEIKLNPCQMLITDCNYFFNLREVLEDDSGGAERNLGVLLGGLSPVQDGLDVPLLDGEVVAVADGALEEDATRVGQRLWGAAKTTRSVRRVEFNSDLSQGTYGCGNQPVREACRSCVGNLHVLKMS